VDYDVEIGLRTDAICKLHDGFNFPQVVARAAGIVRNGNGGKKSRDYTKSRIYRLPV
jgi:hypothetical protein